MFAYSCSTRQVWYCLYVGTLLLLNSVGKLCAIVEPLVQQMCYFALQFNLTYVLYCYLCISDFFLIKPVSALSLFADGMPPTSSIVQIHTCQQHTMV